MDTGDAAPGIAAEDARHGAPVRLAARIAAENGRRYRRTAERHRVSNAKRRPDGPPPWTYLNAVRGLAR